MILTACGGGPADVSNDADVTVATDTVATDTPIPDINGGDVEDNGRDVEDSAGGDDTVLDAIGDAVPGDTAVDALCVPDCSDGPCTDDGCGGDCCDDPNVCQEPESGVGLECVPVPEMTCRQMWDCATDCDRPECAEACINAGSAEGQAQLDAVLNCANQVCAGNATEECVYATIEPGAECFDEFNACV